MADLKTAAEKEQALRALVAEFRGHRDALIPALEKAQAFYGCLPVSVQEIAADVLECPLEEIYAAVTACPQLSMKPKGQYRITVCLGTSCYMKGGGKIYEALQQKLGIRGGECTSDGRFSLESCHCIGACSWAPVLTVNERVYNGVALSDLDTILAEYGE